MNIMKRPYQLNRRAVSQDRTRQKIVDAAIALHQSKGLAATSVDDIAKRAKVGKVTVYRHFPDEMELVSACSGHYFELHPLPDYKLWEKIDGAAKRLCQGLRDTYRFHQETAPMMAQVLAEAKDLPIMAPYHQHFQNAAQVLAAPWRRSAAEKKLLKAAIAHALAFTTWHSLVGEQRLSETKAIELMMRLTCTKPK
ncbi:MAG: TetR/AcrR family transcriptional regulator [Rhodospirillaceae bacterium]|nr:TetR/AcrR family transcriptional regulator [Rhodospirillaceae bacterium]MBT7266048.1 TetR/AcrR family transcriptional regulator [Rhodospirillaceae bacterium]